MAITMTTTIGSEGSERISIELPCIDIATNVRRAYDLILRELSDYNFNHIYRINNYLPNIQVDDTYTEFNRGRAMAFMNHYHCRLDEMFPANIPVSTCVGSTDSKIVIEAITGPRVPHPISNSAQTEPYKYSEKYGHAPPFFSRAAVIDHKMFISGTASIIGEDTVHIGDLYGQFEQTLENIRSLISARNAIYADNKDIRNFLLTVYLDPAYNTIEHRDKLCSLFDRGQLAVTSLRIAELCRPDLLIEIEATEIG